MRTEIVERSGGQLPFAVWFKGFIIRFTATLSEAQRVLRIAREVEEARRQRRAK